MKKKKYLPLYEKWMKSNLVDGSNGLCQNLEEHDLFKLLTPTLHDLEELIKNYECTTWWAGGDRSRQGRSNFNPIRQNIVLFLAAMNNEL